MNSKLQEVFRENVLSGTVEFRQFLDSLGDEPLDEIIELYRWILSIISYSENPEMVKFVFEKLAHYRVAEQLPEFEILQGIWRNSYHNQYDYLYALFKNAKDGSICNCAVYSDGRFNAPPYQDDLEIISEDSREEGPYTIQVLNVRCKLCGTEWEVEIDHIYHYPHSHWRRSSN